MRIITLETELQKRIELVEAWGERVGIYDAVNGSNYLTQKIKAYEELGELCSAELKSKDDEFIDAVGDIFVCLVHCLKFYKSSSPHKLSHTMQQLEQVASSIKILKNRGLIAELAKQIADDFILAAFEILMELSYVKTGDAMKCFDVAYGEIKDRQGRMVLGSFIKKETLEEMGAWEQK